MEDETLNDWREDMRFAAFAGRAGRTADRRGKRLSGSGPAFMYMFVEALADGAVACGLPRAKAVEYAAHDHGRFGGNAACQSSVPRRVEGRGMFPGGSTIVGVQTLENHGFRGAAMDCVIDT